MGKILSLLIAVIIIGFASVWFFAQPAAFQAEFMYPFTIAWHFIMSNWLLSAAFIIIVIVALIKILL
jgi:hypothetical protein